MKPQNLLKYIGFIGIVILVVGIVGLSIQALRSQQDIRNQASVASDVEFTLKPGSTTIKPGQTVPVDIYVNTKNKLVSGFTVAGDIFTDIGGKDSLAISIPESEELVHIKQLDNIGLSKDGLGFTFTLLANPKRKGLFTTQNTPKKIGTLILKPSRSGTIELELNTFESDKVVLANNNSNDYLSRIKRELTTRVVHHNKGYISPVKSNFTSFVVSISADQNNTSNNDKKSCNENCATDTECKSEFVCYKGRCRVDTNREDDKCTVPPQKGLERTCNEYCADSRECNSSFTCYNNRCRLATNIGDTSCKPAPTATPRPATTTTTGVGGPTATTQPKGATPSPKPSATVKPATVTATVSISSGTATPSPSPLATSRPTSNLNSLANFQSGQSTASGLRTSPTPTPTPEIVPLPDELKPENVKSNSRNNTLRTAIIIIAGLGIIGLIGFGIYYWKNA